MIRAIIFTFAISTLQRINTNNVFFFKQKTAYEMRISDWSSDVCSSDLARMDAADLLDQAGWRKSARTVIDSIGRPVASGDRGRSEDCRVGKECVSTCRSRWSPTH